MSSALAIAGTSAVLQSLLNSKLNNSGVGLGSVSVTALAPDLIQNDPNGSAGLQVNLFLHQVTPNAAWRNMALPSLAADGKTRLCNQPLALDLHYLLTAYGTQNFEAEALLGYAVQFLHETPVLARGDIRAALNPSPGPPPVVGNTNAVLNLTGLADQVEMLKVTPATLGREEMAWLWTALKADYRPTFPFQVTVVLIQDQNPAVSALPVLQRAITAQPNLLSPAPTLFAVTPPRSQPAASPGDIVIVTGVNLAGASAVMLVNSRLGLTLSLTPASVGGGSVQFAMPDPAVQSPPSADIPAGIYQLAVQVTTSTDVITSNTLAFAVAPNMTQPPASPITRDAGGNATVQIACAPAVQPGQEASLMIGGQSASLGIIATATNSPAFAFISLQAASQSNPALVRLRVDGVDSPVINMIANPPVFSGSTVVVN